MMAALDRISSCIALAMALTSAAALAKGDAGMPLDDMVVTGTRTETPLLNLAGNSGKVSEKEIDLVRPDHIEQLLNRVSGVMLQRGNGQEQLTAIRSPILTGGAGAGSFLFLEDGIPLRAAGFANINGLFEANYEQAGAIEVVRGPGSALYGSNAVHGLVNVLTRAPSLKLQRSLDISAGPHDIYKAKGTVSDTVGNQAYRLSVNTAHDGGYIEDSGYDQQKLTLRHDYFSDSDSFKTVFEFTNLNQDTAGYSKGYKAYKDTDSVRHKNSSPEAYRDAQAARLSVRWDHDLTEDSYLTITPYLRHTDMDFLMHWQPGKPVENNRHSSVGALMSYNRELAGGHKIIVGTDVEYTQGALSEVQSNPTKFGYTPGVHYDYQVDATVVAPYIHTEWQLLDHTRLTAGARYEYTRYTYDNKTADGVSGKFLRPADRSDTFNNFSPKLGITQSLNKDTSAFVHFATGTRAPQTTDLYRLRSTQNGVEAKSEKMDSVELGVRKLGAGIQYEVTTYYMKKKNYFFRDSDGENVTDGRTRHYGIELGTSIPLSDQFDFAVNYTYARHKYDFDNAASGIVKGNDIDTAPRQLGNIRLGWNFLPKSRAELEWLHVGKYYTDESNAHSYEGHELFNLRNTYAMNSNVTLYGSISNLFNRKYAERADYAFGGYRYFVGEQRAVHGGISYHF